MDGVEEEGDEGRGRLNDGNYFVLNGFSRQMNTCLSLSDVRTKSKRPAARSHTTATSLTIYFHYIPSSGIHVISLDSLNSHNNLGIF